MKRFGSFIVMIALLLAGTLGLAALASAGAQGNADAAHACQQGGYVNWTREDGTTFNDTGACVSYVARGGTLVPIGPTQLPLTPTPPPADPASITLSFQPYAADPNYCLVFAHFRHFAPNTTYDLTYQSREPSTGALFPPRGAGQVTTDGTGAADYQFPLIWDQTDDELRIFTVDVSSPFTRVSC